MPSHFTESQIGLYTLAYCRKCGRMSNHRIDRVAVDSHAGKVGPCMEHGTRHLTAKQQAHAEKANRAARRKNLQTELFAPTEAVTNWNEGKPPAHILDPIWLFNRWIERDAWEQE